MPPSLGGASLPSATGLTMRYAIAFVVLVFLAARTLVPDPDAVRHPRVFPLGPLPAQPGVPGAPLRSAPEAPAPAQPRFTTAPPEDRETFMAAARAAWAYMEREYQPATGLVNSVADYPYATVWDVASAMAGLHSARELGILEQGEYDRRMGRLLRTLNTMRLFDGAAYNKNYSTRTGRIAGRNDREQVSARGYGWSATDLGRLLVWLRIVAVHDPRHAALADSVARRLDYSRLVADGYLWGEDLDRRGRPRRYAEGMIPYEQYAAAGFALWGHRAEKALSLAENAAPAEVLGVPVVTDRRGHGRLTSEPLVMAGLEVGWDGEMRQLAEAALAAQEARWRSTGQVTVASEDAMPQRPYYFYYYTIYGNGRSFGIDVMNPRARLNGPRWVSAKAAYAWHALLPSDYTRLAVGTVERARNPVRGWSSGVYERTGRPTGSENVNTAAVILESALYHARGGRPLALPDAEPRTDAVPAASPTPAQPVPPAPSSPQPGSESGDREMSRPPASPSGASRDVGGAGNRASEAGRRRGGERDRDREDAPLAAVRPARPLSRSDASVTRTSGTTRPASGEETVDTLPSRVLRELFMPAGPDSSARGPERR